MGGGRRVSCVTFGENSIVEIETCRDILEKEDMENEVGQNKEKNSEEDDDVPLPNMRRWTDSLKIKRKKNKPVRDDDTKEEGDDFDEQNEKEMQSRTLMEKTS